MKYLLTTLLFLSLKLYAQPQDAAVYKSADDYKLNNGEKTSVVATTVNSFGYPVDADCDIRDVQEHKGKPIDKRSVLVLCNDTLYVSCRQIKYKRFSPVLYKGDRYLYFRSYTSRLKEHEIQMHIAGKRAMDNSQSNAFGLTEGQSAAMFLGGVGGAVAVGASERAKMLSNRFNYALELSTGKIRVIDIPFMQEVLEATPELDQRYMKEGHPEDIQSIIRYFEAAAL